MTTTPSNFPPIDLLAGVLSADGRIDFAYLYGSAASGGAGRDIDIAVHASGELDPHRLAADLKIDLHRRTGLPPDLFDVRVVNGVEAQGDLFALLYLRGVLEHGRLLVDRRPEVRAGFLERYGDRFRECEGLIQEVLA